MRRFDAMPTDAGRTPITPRPPTTIPAAQASRVLQSNEVHVWRIAVDAAAAPAGDLGPWLTGVEQARAERFTKDEDRLRFRLGRAATRAILARYLGLPSSQVGIDPDRRGKPQLNAPRVALDRRVQFNVSHAGGWILAAFARFAVGIDLEPLRAEQVSEPLIGYVMSDAERHALRALPAERQIGAFFKCWTSKEALLKGVGVGLSVPLRSIEVSIVPDQPAQLLHAPPELGPGDWRLHTLEFCATYATTLAVALPSAQIVQITADTESLIAMLASSGEHPARAQRRSDSNS